MTLYDLTNHESGIICYGGKTVAAVNWNQCADDCLPVLDPLGVSMFPFPHEDGYLDGADENRVDDYRTVLPGSIWLTDETDEDGSRLADTDLDIVYDPFNDLLSAFITPDDPNLGDDFSAWVYTLKSGEVVIAPDMWA